MKFQKSSKCSKNLANVKNKKFYFFERCPNIEIPFFMISNPDFSLFFSSNYRYRLVLKKPFPDHTSIFSQKSRTTLLKIFISRPLANTIPAHPPTPPPPYTLHGMNFHSCEKQIFKSFCCTKMRNDLKWIFTIRQVLTIPLLTEEALFTWAFLRWGSIFKFLQEFKVAYQ